MTKKLKDVIDLKQVKEILNDFFEATGFPIGIIQTDGEIVIKSRWQPICEKFHRVNIDSLKNCHESDKMIHKHLNTENYVDYKCLNGLVDAAIPLVIDEEHVASLFFGQFFYDDDVPDEGYFRKQAKKYSYNEEEYIEAYQQVPVYSHDQVQRVMGFCRSLVNMLVESGQKNLKLKTAIDNQAENARKLVLSERRYKNLVETSIDPIFTMNRSGEYLYINQAAAQQMGGKPKDFIGKQMQEFFPKEIADKQLLSIQNVIDNNIVTKLETRTLIRGELRWYSINIHPVKDEEGKVIFAQSVARDISEFKATQQELEYHQNNLEVMVNQQTKELQSANEKLREEKNFTETAINSLPGVFYMLDCKASFIRWNRNFTKITGYTDEEMSKLSALSLFPKEEQEKVGNAISKVFSEGDSTVEGNFLTKSGEYVPFYLTGYRIEIDGEIYLVGTGIDISELKEAERKLQDIMSELERSNTDLENFAYVASHDLQEPLRKIASFTGLLEQRYSENLDERGLKYMHYITDGTSRMQKLINGLLKVSRVSTRGKEFDKVDMKEVMHQVLDRLSMLIREKNGNIEVKSLPEIVADEGQMISLLQNLIGNALKFCKERKPEIKVSVRERKQDWLFCVEDNGIGISPEMHDKIFIIFQRLHSRDEFPGTGIGLAVCKKIVERHGGKIWLESEPEKGTKFHFTISK